MKLVNTYSMEWPAVIVLQMLWDTVHNSVLYRDHNFSIETLSSDSEDLYVAMSTARVKCTVIMFPMEDLTLDLHHHMKKLLDTLEDSVEIRRYPDHASEFYT